MPDVSSTAPADVRLWAALDVHKLSIVAATLPPAGGQPEIHRIETTERAIRRFIERLGGPQGLALCYEAGPGGFDLLRLLSGMGVACDWSLPRWSPCARVIGSRPIAVTQRSSCGCSAPAS